MRLLVGPSFWRRYWAPKFVNCSVNPTKLTKHFSFILSTFVDCFGSVCVIACMWFFPFMRSSFLYEPNPEIKRPFHLRRKKERLEGQLHKAHNTHEMIDGDRKRTFWDFVTLGVQCITSSIARPNVKAHNFELKSALISVVQQSQFGGSSMEDLNLYLLVFLEVCNTLKS